MGAGVSVGGMGVAVGTIVAVDGGSVGPGTGNCTTVAGTPDVAAGGDVFRILTVGDSSVLRCTALTGLQACNVIARSTSKV